jgi:hypothetical protein
MSIRGGVLLVVAVNFVTGKEVDAGAVETARAEDLIDVIGELCLIKPNVESRPCRILSRAGVGPGLANDVALGPVLSNDVALEVGPDALPMDVEVHLSGANAESSSATTSRVADVGIGKDKKGRLLGELRPPSPKVESNWSRILAGTESRVEVSVAVPLFGETIPDGDTEILVVA